jgi:hypothetical protein
MKRPIAMVTAVAVLLALPASAHAITVTGTAAPTLEPLPGRE